MPDCIWKRSRRSYVCALIRCGKVSSLHLIESDTIDYTYKSAHREELNAFVRPKRNGG